MKSFREYLAENKKVYSFKVKVAGDLPENFSADLKTRLSKCGVKSLDETSRTPVQKTPLDFPELENVEVHIFDVICEYPVTGPELEAELKEMGMDPCRFRVRGAGEPSEVEQVQATTEVSGKSVLQDPGYSEAAKIKHKDYFGDDFNKGFLKDLEKTAKERRKELGQDKAKSDVLGSAPKIKTDKAGIKSAMGS
jgi:hypothetical protein